MYRWLFAALLLLGGCALVSSPAPDSTRKDLALGSDAPADLAFVVRSNDDMAMPPRPLRNDAGLPVTITDMAQPPTGDLAQVPCSAAQHLVINEVQVDGVGDPSNEFIEIYNPCATADVPLTGWKLLHRSTSGTTDQPIIPLQPTSTLKKAPMNGYYLVAGPGFKQTTYDVSYSQAALAAAGGGLALVNDAGKIVDSMGWGAGATNAYVVGSPAPSPSAGQSVARIPDGASVFGDDAKDFKIATTPTPRAAN